MTLGEEFDDKVRPSVTAAAVDKGVEVVKKVSVRALCRV
jgi:hypothetical protein